MNKVVLIGRLTRDPEVRAANNTTIARFTLAVDRRFKQDGGQAADFPSIVTFGKTADFVSKYFKQGTKIGLTGRIQTGSYTNKDGVKVYTTEVIADEVEFAESKKVDPGETPPPSANEWLEVPEGIEAELPFK